MQAEPAELADSFDPPYRPGFTDWLLGRFRFGSRIGWLAYFGLAIAVTLLYWAVAWAEGTLPGHAGVIHGILPLFAFVGLPALAWFNTLARNALASSRPLLKVDSAGYELLTYRLTVMPASLAIVGAGIGLMSLAALTLFQPPNTFEILQIMVTPNATLIEWLLQFLLWTGVGVVGLEIARKLWVIDEIYKNDIQINVLRAGALSAFSRLSAGMVIFTLTAVILATVGLAELGTSVIWLIAAGISTLLAAVAFVGPLWGGHRSMARDKQRNIDMLGERIEEAIRSLRTKVDSNQLADVAPVKDALEALIAARNEYREVSTWPWQRTTLTGVATALIAPMALWLITRWLDTVTLP